MPDGHTPKAQISAPSYVANSSKEGANPSVVVPLRFNHEIVESDELLFNPIQACFQPKSRKGQT